MKYCPNCGAQIDDKAVICVKCGCAVQPINAEPEPDQSVSAGLVVLSVFIPLFGIIYWPVKAKERPKCAKTCGIAAIISWVVNMVLILALS